MTQQQQVTERLRKGWTTGLDALKDCGCMRLAARVLELRQSGLNVDDKWVEVGGKKFKAYRVVDGVTKSKEPSDLSMRDYPNRSGGGFVGLSMPGND
jgi:hypothetical protein